MPASCDIVVQNDADFYYVFAYLMPDLVTPIDLTNATDMIMKVRRDAADVNTLLELSTDTGEIVITDPTNGLFTVQILQSVLVELPLGGYEHSLVVTLSGVKVEMWLGTLTVNAGPSR